MTRKKCRPQKLPKNYASVPRYCEHPKFHDTDKLFRDNVKDIANSLIAIMIICGIHECKANGTRELITNIFYHYDKERHRTDCPKPAIKMCKKTVLCCLGKSCLMTLIEAQMSYYIIKFALKAYFNPIPKNCIKNPVLDLQLICENEYAWKRAAKRTLQVYEECDGILKPLIRKYKQEVHVIYQSLFERMKKRAGPLALPQSDEGCSDKFDLRKSIPVVDISDVANKQQTEAEFEEHPFRNFRKCCRCKFPLELCDCNVNPKSGKLCMDCSQGPYKCDWYRTDKEPRVKAKDHICPIDCADDEDDDDSQLGEDDLCQCELPQLSDCETESACSDEGSFCKCEDEAAAAVCEEIRESSSEEEVEPKMDGCCYCCHQLKCNQTIFMESANPPKGKKQTSDIFVETQILPPAKGIKKVRIDLPKKAKKPNQSKKNFSEIPTKIKQPDDKDMEPDKGKVEVPTENDKKIVKDTKNKEPQVPPKTIESDKKKQEPTLLPPPKTEIDLTPPAPLANKNEIVEKDKTEKVEKEKIDKNEKVEKEKMDKNEKPVKEKTYKTEKQRNEVVEIPIKDYVKVNDGGSKEVAPVKDSKPKKKIRSKKGKLPCCKCRRKKEVPECKKCCHCRPVRIPKNRLVPAPIIC